MIKKITQQNLILSIIENLVRSNIYLFIFFRFLTNKYFAKIIYESDFNFIIYLKDLKFFQNKMIIDVGGNDGISIKAIRKFTNNKIVSFEPNKKNFDKILSLKKKIPKISAFNYGLSREKIKTKVIYEAYYNKYHLSPFDSMSKKDVIKHLKNSLFIKDIEKKIVIKKNFVTVKKLDQFKFAPCFIKIDVQGHEYECVLGSLLTIRKHKPVLMVEYDKTIIQKIYKKLKKINYKKFYFIAKNNKLYEHKNEKVFNVFFIHDNLIANLNLIIK